jgi:peptide/nickel transport system permease protein
MRRLIFKRLAEVLTTMFSATLIIFALTHLAPGDPIEMLFYRGAEIAAVDKNIFNEKKEALRKEYGLDKSLPVQYITWMGRLLKLDFGKSIYTERPVSAELASRFPATILLALTSLVILVVLGLFFGIVSALFASSVVDDIIRFFCVLFASVPGFVIGLGLLALFSVNLKIYRISGGLSLSNLLLPAFIIALTISPQLIRIVRANMLSEFGRIYILSAKARGLNKSRIVIHALRNALLPVITLLALSLSAMIGGSIVIESIFAWPGVGKYALDSIMMHDYPVIQAYALIMTFMVIMINITVDLLYIVLDPRVHEKGAAVNETG